MMSRCPLLVVLFAVPLLLLALPTHAQETDTTMTDAPTPDTTQAAPRDTTDAPAPTDTTQAAAADTTADNETAVADSMAAADSVATADTMTTAADSMATAADSLAADTTLSAERRRARAEEQAQAAAKSWLKLTDAGQFGKSWDAAAPSLQNGISRENWMKRGDRAHSNLNALESRELTRVQYRDSTAQLSTGGPVVALQYRSKFEGGSVLEAVITTKQNGAWKVAGYRVVPASASAQASDSTATQSDSTSQ